MTTDINVWKEERRINREMAFDETDILGGKAVILMNVHEIWQFRMWVATIDKEVVNRLFTEYKSATKVAKHLNISRNSVYRLLQKAA